MIVATVFCIAEGACCGDTEEEIEDTALEEGIGAEPLVGTLGGVGVGEEEEGRTSSY